MVSHRLEAHQNDLERDAAAKRSKANFRNGPRASARCFPRSKTGWQRALRDELTALSIRERGSFLAPLHKVRKQAFRALQQFRDRLSDRTMRAFGVPLRTTETEIDVAEPATPDITSRPSVRQELGTAVAHSAGVDDQGGWCAAILRAPSPIWSFRTSAGSATQWEESINGALWRVEKEARRRLDELIGTVERLVESGGNERAPQTPRGPGADREARKSLAGESRRADAVPVGGDWRRHGSLGAVRGGVGHHDAFRRKFPLGTLVINVTGSFLIGFLMTMLTERFQLDPQWRLLLVVGFLGGYTTFSSFEWETYSAVREGGAVDRDAQRCFERYAWAT